MTQSEKITNGQIKFKRESREIKYHERSTNDLNMGNGEIFKNDLIMIQNYGDYECSNNASKFNNFSYQLWSFICILGAFVSSFSMLANPLNLVD